MVNESGRSVLTWWINEINERGSSVYLCYGALIIVLQGRKGSTAIFFLGVEAMPSRPDRKRTPIKEYAKRQKAAKE
jgi:hypothetical protein